MLALIDGDVLRYRVGFACEQNVFRVRPAEEKDYVASFPNKTEMNKWLEENEIGEYELDHAVEPEPVENCLHSVKLQVEAILDRVKASSYRIYLSGKPNFREQVATIKPYKGNRPDRKPYHYDNITDYLVLIWDAEIVHGIEADDMLGIMQRTTDEETIICTIDKDLDQVPGKHFNFVTDKLYEISEEEGRHNLWLQVLTGDSTDNIQGIPRLGPAKALQAIPYPLDAREYISTVQGMYVDYVKRNDPKGDPDKLRQRAWSEMWETYNLVHMLETFEEADEWLEGLYGMSLEDMNTGASSNVA